MSAHPRQSNDPFVVGVLLNRIHWREGSFAQRLRKAEKQAKRRAKMEVNYIDPDLERAVAELARGVRKAHA